VKFVDSCDEVAFLISGGGSACVELPLAPWFGERDLIEVNARLVDSGLPIAAINTVRKHLSAIKGGRLAARVRGRTVSLIYSDVAAGDLPSVASGPTLPDTTSNDDAAAILHSIGIDMKFDEGLPETIRALPGSETILIADNGTLVETAARIAAGIVLHEPLEEDVASCARRLAEHALQLHPGQVLVAGGEPTVIRRGDGRGGRCSEMALRFAMAMRGSSMTLHALFGSSDGVDGSSGAAGVTMTLPVAFDPAEAASAIDRSDTFPMTARLGRAVMMPPTGNNLRDLYLVARP
jgi:glycerate 2-kinase